MYFFKINGHTKKAKKTLITQQKIEKIYFYVKKLKVF
ncbi:hypothetical protein SAMN05216480_11616 [Pustulibacterium marinum]|uniref:Uncharacterized protein n=1 Tax=Pustulibacterium marinum TaxID=1224947 RepID=A0A1I7IGA1_9FLAO|nr:hypothetical protein SAMN05216480_11616 [Pustulibacterium marinum]